MPEENTNKQNNTGERPRNQRPRGERFRRPAPTEQEFESRLLDLARVVRVSSGGKRLRFRAVIVIGDKKGRVGLGVGKGVDVAQAVEKANRAARKDMIKVITTETGTIPHQVEAKFGAARLILRPQRKGRGLVAGGTVRTVCDLAGIKDVSSKTLGRTSNKLNNAQAVFSALRKIKPVKNYAVKPTQTSA